MLIVWKGAVDRQPKKSQKSVLKFIAFLNQKNILIVHSGINSNEYKMSQSIVDTLKEALKFSPDNVHLKIHLAETLFSMNRIEEAEKEFVEALAMENNERGLMGLARVY